MKLGPTCTRSRVSAVGLRHFTEVLFYRCKALASISVLQINKSIFLPLPETFFKYNNKASLWQHKPDAPTGQSKWAVLNSPLTKNIRIGRASWPLLLTKTFYSHNCLALKHSVDFSIWTWLPSFFKHVYLSSVAVADFGKRLLLLSSEQIMMGSSGSKLHENVKFLMAWTLILSTNFGLRSNFLILIISWFLLPVIERPRFIHDFEASSEVKCSIFTAQKYEVFY